MRRLGTVLVWAAAIGCPGEAVNEPPPPPPPTPPPAAPVRDIVTLRDPGDDIWLVASDGTNPRELTDSGRDHFPQWDGTGTRIFYWRIPTTGEPIGVYRVNADGSNEERLSHVGLNTLLSDVHPTAGVLMTVQDGTTKTWRMDVDGNGETQVITPAPTEDDNGPTWSPDGSRFAFERTDRTMIGPSQLWVADADGSNPIRLAPGARAVLGYHWHPDSELLAAGLDMGSGFDIWLLAADGSGMTQLTVDRQGGGPRWSPDGSRIAFYDNNEDLIHVMRGDGSNITALADGHSYRWSPDGLQIAYCHGAERSTTQSLNVIDPDGTDQQLILENGCRVFIDWRPGAP